RLAIFRAGRHVSVDGREINFSAADVQDLVSSYDPAVHEAPIVIGHPSLNAPAYGWGKSLSVDGQGVVWAEPHQVEPNFAEHANAGRYKKISASIYLPDTPGNPKPGHHYLRHIGFLGAAPPAVKGLPSAEFAAEDGAIEFADSADRAGGRLAQLIERLLSTVNADAAQSLITADQVGDPVTHFAERTAARATTTDTSQETNVMSEPNAAEFAEKQKKIDADRQVLDSREAEIAKREKAIKDAEQKEARTGAAQFADQLVTAGKILPRHKEGIVELQLALGVASPVSFSEGGTTTEKPAAEVLRAFLADLPTQVDFSEKSRATGAADAAPVEFAAPQGAAVDGTRSELYAKAKEYQRTHPGTSMADAVKACGG
ncbi:MAG: hypothetical protein ABI843_09765, partial [Dokdonella sp.]